MLALQCLLIARFCSPLSKANTIYNFGFEVVAAVHTCSACALMDGLMDAGGSPCQSAKNEVNRVLSKIVLLYTCFAVEAINE